MRKELDEKLVEDFPSIFRERYDSPQETCMCWGFPGDGWEPLIREACNKLKVLSDVTGIDFIATQVKEKFGTLRFYFVSSPLEDHDVSADKFAIVDSIAQDIVDRAAIQSEFTCENCGKRGSLRSKGHFVTLCDECDDYFKKNECTWPRRKTGVDSNMGII